MLRVTIELVPFGNEDYKKDIAQMLIANVGKNPDGTYNYVASYIDDRGNEKDGVLYSHDRSKPVLEIFRLMSEVLTFETFDTENAYKLGEIIGILKGRLKLNSKPGSFKVGDKVRLKESIIKNYLDDGHDSYFPASGKLDKEQKKDYDNMILTMLSLAIDSSIQGTVIAHHHPNTSDENFKVEILGNTFNIDPEHLELV